MGLLAYAQKFVRVMPSIVLQATATNQACVNSISLLCREVRLVAELLYSGLTTGAGLQTLGEEYCDILQAAGALAKPSEKLSCSHT